MNLKKLLKKKGDDMNERKLYNLLDTLLRDTECMECIDYTWYSNSASIDLYDIISEENEKEDMFFEEVDLLNNKLKEFYQTEVKKFWGDCEMGAQARIYFYDIN